MSKGKERECEEENVCSDADCKLMHNESGIHGESSNAGSIGSDSPSPKKIRICETTRSLEPNPGAIFLSQGGLSGSSSVEPQDADYSNEPSLDDELEVRILARVPRSEYWKLCFVSKRYLGLVKSGELFKIRGEIGFEEPSVFMLASGESCWWAFDPQFTSRRRLPLLPSDSCFTSGDKECVCAGTHLIVSGKEIDGLVIWRYELAMNRWEKGPSMINPRCLFASASSGTFACVAGGIGVGTNREVLNSAERYNPESKLWEPLPSMKKKRKLCAGCFLDDKFYVIGGKDENGMDLTCGEVFDENRNTWDPIPDMLKDVPVSSSQSPPLVAVVNNELYSLEVSSNQLRVYLKRSKSWKVLGPVPVRADFNRGWGVAFKSLGNELLVIGATSVSSFVGHGMTICTCAPHPDAEELQWRTIDNGRNRLSHFILNCSVMVA